LSVELTTVTINMKSFDQEISDPITAGGGDANGRTLRVVFAQEAEAQLTSKSKVYLSWKHQQEEIKGYNVFDCVSTSDPVIWEIKWPRKMLKEGDVTCCIELVDDISIVQSQNFNVHVIADPNDGSEYISSNDFSLFQQATIDMNSLLDTATEKFAEQDKKVELVKEALETVQKTAEKVAINSDEAKTAAQIATDKADEVISSVDDKLDKDEAVSTYLTQEAAANTYAAQTSLEEFSNSLSSSFGEIQSKIETCTENLNNATDNIKILADNDTAINTSIANISETVNSIQEDSSTTTSELINIKNEMTELKTWQDNLDSIGDYSALDETVFTGIYSLVNHKINTGFGGQYILKEVLEGEVYQVSSSTTTKNVPIICWFLDKPTETSNSSIYLSSEGVCETEGTNKVYTDLEITVPNSAVYMLVQRYGGGTTEAPYIKGKKIASRITTDIAKVSLLEEEIEALKTWKNIDLNIENNYWNGNNKKYQDNSSAWSHAVIQIDPVKKYKMSGWGSSSAPGIIFFSGEPSASTQISYMLTGADYAGTSYGAGAIYKDFEFIPPSSATHAVIQTYASVQTLAASVFTIVADSTDSTATLPIEYSLKNGVLTTSVNYDNDSFKVNFGKRGPNSLPDFKQICIKDKIEYNNVTDWHGPYVMSAVNNADGDQVSNQYFTGGNHNYNNSGSSDATATARNLSLNYFADGKLLTEGDSGYAQHIEYQWTNRIQAYNTTKADGSGREVLEERHRMVYDGLSFETYIEIEPLEDVNIQTWYGLQTGIGWTNVQYIGGANRAAYKLTDGKASGNKLPSICAIYNDTDRLEMEIDRTLDLGTGILLPEDFTQGYFSTSYGKCYSYLIKDANLSSGDIYGTRGYWRFIPIKKSEN
jgi:hypothetical protein